jgi:hypothetical protein
MSPRRLWSVDARTLEHVEGLRQLAGPQSLVAEAVAPRRTSGRPRRSQPPKQVAMRRWIGLGGTEIPRFLMRAALGKLATSQPR